MQRTYQNTIVCTPQYRYSVFGQHKYSSAFVPPDSNFPIPKIYDLDASMDQPLGRPYVFMYLLVGRMVRGRNHKGHPS